MVLTYDAIARRIDHALLLPTLTDLDMRAGCQMAAAYGVATVCLKPYAVPLAVHELRGTVVGVGTVVGFPHGATTIANTVAETQEALAAGASEIDMVINIGAVLSAHYDLVEAEISQINAAVRQQGGILKVILETCYLNDTQKTRLCQIAGHIGVDFVKTSTGFGPAGATEADVRLLREAAPAHVKVKASGGIKDLATAIKYSELGADRLGVSRTAEILDELRSELSLSGINVSRETRSAVAEMDRY